MHIMRPALGVALLAAAAAMAPGWADPARADSVSTPATVTASASGTGSSQAPQTAAITKQHVQGYDGGFDPRDLDKGLQTDKNLPPPPNRQ